MLVLFAHWVYLPFGRRKGHQTTILTAALTRKEPIPTFIRNIKQRIPSMTHQKCIICKTTNPNLTQISPVQPYAKLEQLDKNWIFSFVSIDLLGPISLKISKASRHHGKFHFLIITCVKTGLVTFQLLDGTISTNSVIMALLTHQAPWNPITKIVTDAGG